MAKRKSNKKKKSTVWAVLFFVLAALALVVAFPVKDKVESALYPETYQQEVLHWAEEYGVDPYLVFAVIKTESGFDPNAVSDAGARGLMQMTQDTFDWIKSKIARQEDLTFDDLFQPDTSIRFGTYFIALSLERYQGDISTAAAAYHSGWGTVDKLLAQEEYSDNGVHLTHFPYRQMSHYVNKINKNYAEYLRIYASNQ